MNSTSGRGRNSVEGEIRHAIRNAQENLDERLMNEIEAHKKRIDELRRQGLEMAQEIHYLRRMKNAEPQQSAIMEGVTSGDFPFGNNIVSYNSLLTNDN